jgi:hypothetical protein
VKQIIGDMAARNGERGLMAAWENNAHIVSRSALKLIAALPLYVGGWMRRSVARLRQEGHDEIADDLAQYHTEQLAAAKQAQAPAWAAKFWAQEFDAVGDVEGQRRRLGDSAVPVVRDFQGRRGFLDKTGAGSEGGVDTALDAPGSRLSAASTERVYG